MRPVYAVVISLMGQAWNNTFGTLAVAWLGLTQVSDAGSTTALYASVFIWICNLVSILVVCWLYGRARGLREGLPAALALSLVQGGLTLILSQVDPTLSGFTAGIVGFALIFAIGRLPFYRHPTKVDSRIFETAPAAAAADGSATAAPATETAAADSGAADKPEQSEPSMSLGKTFIPYYALVILAFVVLAVPTIKNFVAQVSFGPAFPKLTTTLGVVTKAADESVSIFTSAGSFLFAAAFIGFIAYALMGNIHRGGWSRVWAQTAMKATPSSIAVVALVAMSEVMKGGGQTDVLAQGTALLTGSFYPFLAPFIGLLGCFMTGSNLASNLIFGSFQQVTAHAAGLAHAPVLAGQTAGAATGAMVAPPKVLLGTTTAGILGREGDVMRITFAVALPIAAIIGVIALFFV